MTRGAPEGAPRAAVIQWMTEALTRPGRNWAHGTGERLNHAGEGT